ncbi:hypothetical protein BDN72DRAFT_875574 [Pluteus cervinus]|uniref:Uncharacterized protein n=1 Tax=Pluteus cervinus TaxID=181527 RepID=A0ACD3B6C8_9AGAR|nr:hypothetical protein BDN72DRAFT_875574 [Pluteus cervinus]
MFLTEGPRLPPELEEIIFTLALRADMYEAHNLLPVAKRVFAWLNPIIYEVVVKDKDRCWPPNLSLNRLQRYGGFVRHLLLAYEFPEVPEYIALCPHVYDMGLWTGIPYTQEEQDELANLRLTRLSTNVPALFDKPLTPKMITLFSNITHLDITSQHDYIWEHRYLLFYFPALTHITLFTHQDHSLLAEVLEMKPDLKVIIWLLGRREGGEEGQFMWALEDDKPPLGDDRIVFLSLRHPFEKDWEEGARGNMDVWRFAEHEISKRAERRKKALDSALSDLTVA